MERTKGKNINLCLFVGEVRRKALVLNKEAKERKKKSELTFSLPPYVGLDAQSKLSSSLRVKSD